MKYILFLILSLANLANAATVMEWQEATFTNLLKNPGFENGSAKWTPSVSSTFQILSGNQVLIETRSASFTATAASQTVQSALYTLPKGLVSGDCESQILYQTNSNVYRMRVLNASGAVIAQQPLPAVSSSSVAKMFFPCSISGTTSVRSDVISSATAGVNSITWDQNHLGSIISSKTGAVVGPWQSYTPTFAGLGTVTNIDFKWRRNGSNIEVTGTATTGTVTASQLQIGLPTGYITSTADLSTGNTVIGSVTRGNAGANANYILANRNLSYVLGGVQAAASGSYNIINGNGILSSSENFSLNFSVPIVGLSGSSTTFDSRCPNDISCNNIFTAFISGAGAVSEESGGDWINGNCTGTNPYSCTLNSGLFTVPLNCTGSSSENGVASSARVWTKHRTATTNTTLAYTMHQSGAGNVSSDSYVTCVKDGADFVTKNQVEGFLSKTVTSTGNFIERIERVRFHGATDTTNCTASPCTLSRNSGAIISVTRVAAGVYLINFAAGTWSGLPVCTAGLVQVEIPGFLGADTLTQIQLNTYNTAGANVDGYANVICVGPR